MSRKAAFAGLFYEADPQKLSQQITECYTHKRGPGAAPTRRTDKKLQAVIAPVASYQYGGPCAAWAYKELAETTFPDVYIIIGPATKTIKNSTMIEGYETPLGLVRVDQELANALMKKNDQIVIDEAAHKEEQSIEVQLPFLQQSAMDKEHELKILPLLLSEKVNVKQLGLDLKELLMDLGKNAVFIISSNFTRYGRKYHYIPFSKDVRQNIYDMDREVIEFLKQRNLNEFLKFIHDKFSTIEGYVPMGALLFAIKDGPVRLEQYYTSADVDNDARYTESVSYASVLFD